LLETYPNCRVKFALANSQRYSSRHLNNAVASMHVPVLGGARRAVTRPHPDAGPVRAAQPIAGVGNFLGPYSSVLSGAPSPFTSMPTKLEDQPWYREWHETLERVIAAQMARDSTKADTSEREADREYQSALARFRALAKKIRPQSS